MDGRDVTENPLAASPAHEESMDSRLEARVAELEQQLAVRSAAEGDGLRGGAAAAVARLNSAPTNWHQATIYFLTSEAEEDAVMHRRAPLMFAAGLVMVIVQVVAMYGVVMGMMHPPCINNLQCAEVGFFCEVARDGSRGRCSSCGESAPFIPYEADTLIPGGGSAVGAAAGPSGTRITPHQEFNKIFDQSYPHREIGLKRSDIPDGFAGWNFTMVQHRCARPIQSFRYASEWRDDNIVMTDQGDLPEEFQPTRDDAKHFSARTVKNWCAACTRTPGPDDYLPDPLNENGLAMFDNTTGLEVSVMNSKLRSILAVNAMSMPDWTALLLCSYVVGMTIVGEIKDTQLCSFSVERTAKDLSAGWKIALELLGVLRSHFFLMPLMVATPVVVLTQGGSAMSICFNTIVRLAASSYRVVP
jgi:hypothetical protein